MKTNVGRSLKSILKAIDALRARAVNALAATTALSQVSLFLDVQFRTSVKLKIVPMKRW